MKNNNHLHYNPLYARLLIFLGIFFTVIFILGFIMADMIESLFYCFFSGLMIVVGFSIQKGPYATYSNKELRLFNFNNRERECYSFNKRSEISIINDLLYLNGKKLKINKWFLNKEEWQRMVLFFQSSETDLISELRDDSSSL